MKYTKEQRLDIGKQIYDGKLTRYEAAEKYNINDQTARSYMRMYRDVNHLPARRASRSPDFSKPTKVPDTLESYEDMSKEDLIKELVKARINEARLKKGYEVKGDGSIIRYSSKNTR